MNTRQYFRFAFRVALLVPLLLILLVATPRFAEAGDPPPMSVTDKTEVLDSKTEKIPNPITPGGDNCDQITRQIKVTPQKGEPMVITEKTTLCPNPVRTQPQSKSGDMSILGVSSMVQYAPPPSYTCGYSQGMGSGWTTDTTATWWLWYSYFYRSTNSYGTFGTSLNGYTYAPTTFTSQMGGQSNIRYYAATFQTSPAAIQSGNGTWCY